MGESVMMRNPEEVRCAIADQVDDVQDLRSLRLVSSLLLPAATRAMFSSVRLYQTRKSMARFNNTLNDPVLKTLVKHLEINTVDNFEEDDYLVDSIILDDELCDLLGPGFTALRRLSSVSLRFSPCTIDRHSRHYPENWEVYYLTRYPIIKALFDALERPEAARIKDVRLEHLKNKNHPFFLTNATFPNVLSRLESLRLYIAARDIPREGDLALQRLYDEDSNKFMLQLPQFWLSPSCENLTTFVLYQDVHFGFLPKLDLRGIHFRKLRTLSLGRYVFSHEWQLDWLAGHASTLENLYLDECTIQYYRILDKEAADSEGYPLYGKLSGYLPQSYLIDYKCFFNDMTWSRIYTHLRENFPSLRRFRTGKSKKKQAKACDGSICRPAPECPLCPFQYEHECQHEYECTCLRRDDGPEPGDIDPTAGEFPYVVFNGYPPCYYPNPVLSTWVRGMLQYHFENPWDEVRYPEETFGARDFHLDFESRTLKEDHVNLILLLRKLGQRPVRFKRRNWYDYRNTDLAVFNNRG